MKRKLKYLLAVAAGFWGGLLTAQALIMAYARNGANFGSEPLTLLALPLLIWCGYIFGHDSRDSEVDEAYRRGLADGKQLQAPLNHSGIRFEDFLEQLNAKSN